MITSDRRPARTRNTTIIVVLGPINAVAATPWVDFRVGESIRTLPIRARIGRMSERGLAPEPARLIVSLGRRSRSARNRRATEPPMPESALPQCRNPGFPAGPRYWRTPSGARALTQVTAIVNRNERLPRRRDRGNSVASPYLTPSPDMLHRNLHLSPQRSGTGRLPIGPLIVLFDRFGRTGRVKGRIVTR